jgi:hypothetical protein
MPDHDCGDRFQVGPNARKRPVKFPEPQRPLPASIFALRSYSSRSFVSDPIALRNMTAIDATGLRAIQDSADKLKEAGKRRYSPARYRSRQT